MPNNHTIAQRKYDDKNCERVGLKLNVKTDADILKKKGYQIEKIQAVDCFCHTYHVENVILFSKK